MAFSTIGLGFYSSNKSYMASHVEAPPYLLHVVSENRGIISDLSDVAAFPLFNIVPNDTCCGFFLKWSKGVAIG